MRKLSSNVELSVLNPVRDMGKPFFPKQPADPADAHEVRIRQLEIKNKNIILIVNLPRHCMTKQSNKQCFMLIPE